LALVVCASAWLASSGSAAWMRASALARKCGGPPGRAVRDGTAPAPGGLYAYAPLVWLRAGPSSVTFRYGDGPSTRLAQDIAAGAVRRLFIGNARVGVVTATVDSNHDTLTVDVASSLSLYERRRNKSVTTSAPTQWIEVAALNDGVDALASVSPNPRTGGPVEVVVLGCA
jgi:hypothetical protein